MGVIAQRCLGVLQELSAAIRVTRAPLLLAGLSLLILSTPAQVLELYLLLARNWARLWPQVLLALGSLVALSIFITLVSRGLIHANEDANAARRAQTLSGAVVRALPSLFGILPLLGAAIGLHSALQSTLTEPLLRSVAIFDAVRSPPALAETVRTITSIPDVDAKIQALFPDGGGPRYSRPDPEQLAALGRVVQERRALGDPRAATEDKGADRRHVFRIRAVCAVCCGASGGLAPLTLGGDAGRHNKVAAFPSSAAGAVRRLLPRADSPFRSAVRKRWARPSL